MTQRIPLVLVGGQVSQLPTGDTIPGLVDLPTGSLSSRDLATRSMLAMVEETGNPINFLQESLWQKNVSFFVPAGLGATIDSFCFPNANAGTPTARYVGGSNLFTTARRIGYTSAATASSFASIRHTNSILTVGQGGGRRGFFCSFKFGISDPAPVANAAFFSGLYINASPTASFEPLDTNRTIGVGCAAGETTLSMVAKGNGGASHVINLGVNFPSNTSNEDWYSLILHSPSSLANRIYYKVTRENTGHTAAGELMPEFYPTLSDTIGPLIARFNKASALAVAFDVGHMYFQTDN